jgi:hypothetical protein
MTSQWASPERVTNSSWSTDYFLFLITDYALRPENRTGPREIQFDTSVVWGFFGPAVPNGVLPTIDHEEDFLYFGFGSGISVDGQDQDVINQVVAVQSRQYESLKEGKTGTPYALLSVGPGKQQWKSIGLTYDGKSNIIENGNPMTGGYAQQLFTYNPGTLTKAPSDIVTSFRPAGVTGVAPTLLFQEFLSSQLGMSYTKNCCYHDDGHTYSGEPKQKEWCDSPEVDLKGEGTDGCDATNNAYCLSLDMAMAPNPDPWCACYGALTDTNPLNQLIQSWIASKSPAQKEAHDEFQSANAQLQKLLVPYEANQKVLDETPLWWHQNLKCSKDSDCPPDFSCPQNIGGPPTAPFCAIQTTCKDWDSIAAKYKQVVTPSDTLNDPTYQTTCVDHQWTLTPPVACKDDADCPGDHRWNQAPCSKGRCCTGAADDGSCYGDCKGPDDNCSQDRDYCEYSGNCFPHKGTWCGANTCTNTQQTAIDAAVEYLASHPKADMESLQKEVAAAALTLADKSIASPVCYDPSCGTEGAYQNKKMLVGKGASACPDFCANIINVDSGQPYSYVNVDGICQQINCQNKTEPNYKNPTKPCSGPPEPGPPGPGPPGPSVGPSPHAGPVKINWALYGGIGGGLLLLLIAMFILL